MGCVFSCQTNQQRLLIFNFKSALSFSLIYISRSSPGFQKSVSCLCYWFCFLFFTFFPYAVTSSSIVYLTVWNLCEKQITSVHSTECVQRTCFLQSILVVYCFVWFQEKTYAIALYSENSNLKEEQWKKPFKNWFCSSLR